jgi:hypothetical protein
MSLLVWTALLWRSIDLLGLNERDDILHVPKPISDARRDRRGDLGCVAVIAALILPFARLQRSRGELQLVNDVSRKTRQQLSFSPGSRRPAFSGADPLDDDIPF